MRYRSLVNWTRQPLSRRIVLDIYLFVHLMILKVMHERMCCICIYVCDICMQMYAWNLVGMCVLTTRGLTTISWSVYAVAHIKVNHCCYVVDDATLQVALFFHMKTLARWITWGIAHQWRGCMSLDNRVWKEEKQEKREMISLNRLCAWEWSGLFKGLRGT